MIKKNKKIGILIVAYNVENLIGKVLDRIPASVKNKVTEIVVFDDNSKDKTIAVAESYKKNKDFKKLKICQNENNLGYGGNQKKGYSYFIGKGYDLVILLHGDGQYAPELLPQLLKPLEEDKCCAVFGSRMLDDPLKGGMPFYKYLGNKFLTTIENMALGSDMTEYHSGYRIYSCCALKQIPFMENSNDFHFDTEIIIQFKQKDLKILELPIPTYYGDEVSNLKAVSYGFNVLKAVLRYKLTSIGLIHDKKFLLKK